MKHAVAVMISFAMLTMAALDAHSQKRPAIDASDAQSPASTAASSDEHETHVQHGSEAEPTQQELLSGFLRYSEALAHAENAFAFGDYETAVRTLRPWLYPRPIRDATRQNTADGYAVLGASAWFMDALDISERYFKAGLTHHPTMKLDPLVFPPALVSFFQTLRKSMNLTDDEDAENADTSMLYIESRISEHPIWVSMLPFGYGMFVNDKPEWGAVYALTEGALLTVSTALFWVNYAKRQPSDDPQHPMGYEDPRRAKMRKRVHIGTGAAFLGVVLINIIHGAAIHKQSQQVQYRTLSAPPEGFESSERSERTRRSERNQHRWNIQIGPYSNAFGGP